MSTPQCPSSKEEQASRLVTRLSRDLPHSPLGVTLTHALAPVVDVPLAWPSVVRQRVRNDYPLLALLELGARHVRFPAADVDDPHQRRRLALLRDEGVTLTATWLWQPALDLPAEVMRHTPLVETVEMQLPGATLPTAPCLEQIDRCACDLGVAVSLAPVLPNEQVRGKQLRRTRVGYRLDEVVALNQWLGEHGARLDRVLCRVDAATAPWDALLAYRDLPALDQIGALDWAVTLPAGGDAEHTVRAAEAVFAAALAPDALVFLEPLIDLDRTMDLQHGLLDRLCNPRPTFHAVRCLNTVLYSEWPSPIGDRRTVPRAFSDISDVSQGENGGNRTLELCHDDRTYRLVSARVGTGLTDVSLVIDQGESVRRCRLAAGTIEVVSSAP